MTLTQSIVYSSNGPFNSGSFSDPTDIKPIFYPTPQAPMSNGNSDAGSAEIPTVSAQATSPTTWQFIQHSVGEVISTSWNTIVEGGRVGWTVGSNWLQRNVIQPTTFQLNVISHGEVTSPQYWSALFNISLSLGMVGLGALISWGLVGRQALFGSIGAITAGGKMIPWLNQLFYGAYGGAGLWTSIRNTVSGSRIAQMLSTRVISPFISSASGSTLSKISRGLQSIGSSFGRGFSRLSTGITSITSNLKRIRLLSSWATWGSAVTKSMSVIREGLFVRFWKERRPVYAKAASTIRSRPSGGYASSNRRAKASRNAVNERKLLKHLVKMLLPVFERAIKQGINEKIDHVLNQLKVAYNQLKAQVIKIYSKIKEPLAEIWDKLFGKKAHTHPPGPTLMDAAILADHVYIKESLEEAQTDDLPNGWELGDVYETGSLKIGIYARTATDGSMEYVLVNRGTQNWAWSGDGDDNVKQLFGESEDMKNSIDFSKTFVDNHPDAHITFVGHSKGGAEAAANAVATDKNAILFNPATVNLKGYGLNNADYTASMTAYIVEGDILNIVEGWFSKPIDNMIYLPTQHPIDTWNPIKNVNNSVENHLMSSVKDAIIEWEGKKK